MKIFVVDDSPAIRERIVGMLQAVPGAEVIGQSGHAGSAIEGILASRPEIVLLDLSLSEGSGFDVLRAVCPRAPEIDFYMLSNFAADPYRQLAGRLGAREFFDKSKEFERVRDLLAARAAAQH